MTNDQATRPYRNSPLDLTGQTFGRLKVVRQVENSGRYRQWLCLCECGNEATVKAQLLRNGKTQSCGCLYAESRTLPKKHGHSGHGEQSRAYRAWQDIKTRCGNLNRRSAGDYIGRGIEIAPEWVDDFEAFFAHVGEPADDSLTIDRKDNEKGYVPGNVRWISRQEQMRNTRRNVYIATATEAKCETEWAEVLGVKRYSFRILSRTASALRAFAASGREVKWYGRLADAPDWVKKMLY